MIQWIKDLFRPDEAQGNAFAFVEETLRARIGELEQENEQDPSSQCEGCTC